jgi:hypothetical protein
LPLTLTEILLILSLSATAAELTKVLTIVSARLLDTNPVDDFNNGNGKGGKFKRKANLSPGVPPGQTD